MLDGPIRKHALAKSGSLVSPPTSAWALRKDARPILIQEQVRTDTDRMTDPNRPDNSQDPSGTIAEGTVEAPCPPTHTPWQSDNSLGPSPTTVA